MSAWVCMFCNEEGLILPAAEVAVTIRAMAALAILVPPPVFPERGWSGVFAPVLVDEEGGTMFPGDSRNRDGS